MQIFSSLSTQGQGIHCNKNKCLCLVYTEQQKNVSVNLAFPRNSPKKKCVILREVEGQMG